MKALLSVLLVLLCATAYGVGLTSVQVNGETYTNISDVHLTSTGLVILIYPGGGAAAKIDLLPADFLASWNIKQADQSKAKDDAAKAAQADIDRRISEGRFREVDGIVYNTLAPASGWVTFQNAKLLQSLDDGAIINLTPDADDYACIFLNNPPAVSDYQYFTFTALPVGTYSYVNKNEDDRTIRKYDFGRIVYRDEIPLTVLNGQKAFDLLAANGRPQTDVISTLPDSDNLTASGSGFFISSDGYLITNNHVVKNAHRVKVKNADGVYDAEVIRVDETNDLALLKVGGQFNPLTISPDDVALGDSVFTIGFPDIQLQGTHPKYTSGQISGLTGIQDDPNEYQISVPVQPGNSGGPLVDSAGSVKGVIVAHLDDFAALRAVGSLPQNVNYAIKGKILRDFIGAGTEVKLTSFTPDPHQVSPIPKVQKAVATVLVY